MNLKNLEQSLQGTLDVDDFDASAIELDDNYTEEFDNASLEIVTVETKVDEFVDNDVGHDYVAARNNLYSLDKIVSEMLAKSAVIANNTQSDKALATFNSIANTYRYIQKDILSLNSTYNRLSIGKDDKKENNSNEEKDTRNFADWMEEESDVTPGSAMGKY